MTPADKKAELEDRAKVVLDSLPSMPSAILGNDQGTNDSSVIAAALAAANAKPVQNAAPGAFVPKSKTEEAMIGWNAFSKLPNPGDEVALGALASQLGLDQVIEIYKGSRTETKNHEDMVSHFLSEVYYGEWYHNAAVMMFAVTFSWFLTWCGGGLMACLVIGAFLSTYYQASIRRLRRNVRDDIQREMSVHRLETETESADWINHFMSRFWLIYEPVLSAQIIETADAILVDSTPAFLDSIRLTSFTLGTKAPRIESIKTITKTEPNVVCMDWKFSFVPNDTLDMTERDLQSKVNPKIVITVRVGKGMLGAGMPILLEDLAFSGHLRLKFRMFNEFPHIKTVEASFLDNPVFDYVLKPVGGETFGFDINNIPGLEPFIREQVHATLQPMMYAPNSYVVDVAGMMSGATDINSTNGVLVVRVHSATGLKDSDLFGTLDPYITFHIGDKKNAEVGRTKAIEDNHNPKFDETLFILLNHTQDVLLLDVKDKNVGRSDTSIGICSFDLRKLDEADNVVEGLSLPVLKKGKTYGEVKADFHYFPINLPDKQEDGTLIPPQESNSGVLRFTVHECKDLHGNKSSEVSPFAVVKVNGQEKLKTSVYKRNANPRWDKSFEVFVTDKTKLDLDVEILDSNVDNRVLGRWSSALDKFEEDCFIDSQDWWALKDGTGKLHLSMQWKHVTMTGYTEQITGYRPPIGVVRVFMESAEDLKNVEAMTGGKSDPYVRVMSGVQNRGQTEHIDDDLCPVWKQAIYVPVHSKVEDLVLEVMDYNDNTKDKSLGITDLHLKDLISETKTEDGQSVFEGLAPVSRNVDLMSLDRKKGRGTLRYTASFFPTLALAKEQDNKEEELLIEEEHGSDVSEEPEIIHKPKELPQTDLHGEIIQYKEEKINLPAYESGVLVVTVKSFTLPEPTRAIVDLCLDSNDPQFNTLEQKGAFVNINETSTFFVKELDFSKLIVRVRKARDDEKDEKAVLGRATLDTQRIVQNLMADKDSQEVSLLDCSGGKVHLSFVYIPTIQFKLDPSESLENQGNLTVTLVKASNLAAADRSGTSDPFVRFYQEGQRIFKSQTYKKTLNPVFSKEETFTAAVVDRTTCSLIAKVFDWDQIGKDTLLGECEIPFTSNEIETFTTSTKEYPLVDGSGSLTLRLTWRPDLVARKRSGGSFFSATTRVFTHNPGKEVAHGIGAGTKVLGAGVSAIGSGIRGIGRMGTSQSIRQADDASSIASRESTQSSTTATQPRSIGDETATIKVQLLEARQLKAMDRGGTSDPYCRVRIGSKVVHKTRHIKKTLTPQWNETFTATISPKREALDLKVKDHNTLNDVDIGDCSLKLDQQQPFDGWLSLIPEGTGEIHVKVDFL
ncbi:C2 domain-containing protein [Sporodiniella umbellata]|nr:C2 domain-containing protein [Sporodiniella umbellata]